MNKKKIGELDGTPIVTGGKNYTNEHEYYMTLNGDNTYQKLEQRTNGDLFKTILGEGSGNNTNPGYNVIKSFVTLDNESVTTTKPDENMPASYGDFTNTIELEEGSTYIVVFDGVEYQCIARKEDFAIAIGCDADSPQLDFAEYPFAIATDEEASFIVTENPGTYQVEIKELNIDSVTVSDDFSAAVEYVNETLPSLKCATVVLNNENDWTAGFKIYFQKECIYDTTELNIVPSYFYDDETASMRIDSGNRNSIPKEMFNIDALLINYLDHSIILYKDGYSRNVMGGNIDFSSTYQLKDGNTLITGSNCINIYSSYLS